ncbi:protein MHF2 homolog isoform X4 [Nymphaea colorata]|uniref:protein MHF2 homolog isoform X4 n=1 Tax=Nymphaea colorata TaxID=210225 RepID=UPI00129DFD8D|nr:protein MHF2 homolog isoform X4 [Nymphaea colorata]
MADNPFDAETVHEIFKLVWRRKTQDRERGESTDDLQNEAVGGASKKRRRPTTANANALKLSCELLRIFVAEAVQRAAIIAEAEGLEKVEATHLERVLPQLLLDF